MANEPRVTSGLYKETLLAGLWRENPVFRLLLGMCPTLAVTAAVKPALTMGLSVIFVLVCSNIVVSLMRNLLKPHLRILMFTLTIATFVTIADLFLKAFQPRMSETLGPYVPLIIVNCIIICRAETCASKNGFVVSIIDALGCNEHAGGSIYNSGTVAGTGERSQQEKNLRGRIYGYT